MSSPNSSHHLRLPALSRIGARYLDLATGLFAIVHLCLNPEFISEVLLLIPFDPTLSRQPVNLLLLQPVINGLEVRTPDPVHFLAVLQHHKGRHSSDLELLSHPPHLVHIDLEEPNVLVLLTELANLGGNGLAGTAPGRVEVNEDGAGGSEGLEDHLAVHAGRCQRLMAWIGAESCMKGCDTHLSMLDTFP